MAYQSYNNMSQSDRQKKNNSNNQQEDVEAKVNNTFKTSGFKSQWISNEADADMPAFAEKMAKEMVVNRTEKDKLTNSKIRGVYGEIKRIQMGEFEKMKSSFYLLKPKMAYAVGREDKNGGYGLRLFKRIFDEIFPLVKDQTTYNNFCNLIEAILAYHKFFGGK